MLGQLFCGKLAAGDIAAVSVVGNIIFFPDPRFVIYGIASGVLRAVQNIQLVIEGSILRCHSVGEGKVVQQPDACKDLCFSCMESGISVKVFASNSISAGSYRHRRRKQQRIGDKVLGRNLGAIVVVQVIPHCDGIGLGAVRILLGIHAPDHLRVDNQVAFPVIDGDMIIVN